MYDKGGEGSRQNDEKNKKKRRGYGHSGWGKKEKGTRERGRNEEGLAQREGGGRGGGKRHRQHEGGRGRKKGLEPPKGQRSDKRGSRPSCCVLLSQTRVRKGEKEKRRRDARPAEAAAQVSFRWQKQKESHIFFPLSIACVWLLPRPSPRRGSLSPSHRPRSPFFAPAQRLPLGTDRFTGQRPEGKGTR